MVVKFLEQFVLIARALERQGLYDAEDAFFYDRITRPSGETTSVRVKTIAGLIPLLPAVALPLPTADSARRLGKRFARLRQRFLETGGSLVGRVRELGDRRTVLLSVISPDDLRRTLREFFDEDAFLSPHGLRAVSKRYENARTRSKACPARRSTTSRPSRRPRCSAATRTGAAPSGCR